jgi:hypothetical protein
MKNPCISLSVSVVCAFVLLFTANRASAANLVTNGDFETGNFTGWTVTNAASGSNIAVRTIPPGHGTLGAAFGATGTASDSISQILATTPGASYDLSFFYEVGFPGGNPLPPANNKFEVFFNGVSVGSPLFPQSDVNPGFINPVTITGLIATGSMTTLEFQGRNALSLSTQTSTGYDYLDDVTVTASVPESGTSALLMVVGLMGLIGFNRIRAARRS